MNERQVVAEVPAADTGTEKSEHAISAKNVLESRSTFYRMLASLYFNPLTQEQVEAFAHTDFGAYAELGEDFAQGANDIARYLRKQNTGTRDELACDFTGTFVGTKSLKGRVAVPYESVFTSAEGLLCQESFHQVCAEFRRASVGLAPGVDWPDDHLSFLFQFLAILSDRAAESIASGDNDAARDVLEDSRDFLHRHVESWFGDFFKLASQLVETRFYSGVLKITRGFVELDGQTLDDLLERLR